LGIVLIDGSNLIITKQVPYPILAGLMSSVEFGDQCGSCPIGATTAAILSIRDDIACILQSSLYVHIIALDICL